MDQLKPKHLYADLIVLGLPIFLEKDVDEGCRREKDVKDVESILTDASEKYAQIIKAAAGASKTCTLKVDEHNLVRAPIRKNLTLAMQSIWRTRVSMTRRTMKTKMMRKRQRTRKKKRKKDKGRGAHMVEVL